MLGERHVVCPVHPGGQAVSGGQRRSDSRLVAAGSAPFGQVRAGAHTHRQQPPAEDHPLGSRQSLQQPIHVLQRLARPQRPQPYLRSTLPELVNSAKARLDFYWLETSSGRIDLATQQIDFRTAHMQDLLVPGD
jgi:hypothetical protein